MKRIRIGNDFALIWKIMRGDVLEDLREATNIVLKSRVGLMFAKDIPFEVTPQGSVRVEFTPEIADDIGIYKMILEYDLEDSSASDGDQKCKVDAEVFQIVSKTAEADSITQVDAVTDILIGLRGKKFESKDFTEEEWEEIQTPALEAAQRADAATASANTAAQLAIDKAGAANTAASTANTASARADTATGKANTAASTANTAASTANTAASKWDNFTPTEKASDIIHNEITF